MNRSIVIATIIFIFAASYLAQQKTAIFHQDVSWSPDGKYIAFCGMHDFDDKAHTFKADIYVMRADGSDLRMISDPDRNEFYTAWAKGRIAFGADAAESKGSDLYTANPDGTGLRQLTKNAKRNSTPAFSRDGKKIAFVSTRDSDKYQIYVMNADGSAIKRLTTDSNVGYFNPQWSPDGKRILFYAEKGDGKDQIWTMKSDGTDPKLLTANVGHNIFPGWSPDGKKIIFSSSKREQLAGGSFVDGSYLYVMNADGTALAKLGSIQSFFARYSPNGKRIAYVSGKFPSTVIYVANADGSDPVKITK